MRIEEGRYVLYSDQWNWWINEIRAYESGKRKGEQFEVRIAGYCVSLDKLAKDFSERVLRSSDAEDLETALTALKDAETACETLLKKTLEEGAKESGT